MKNTNALRKAGITLLGTMALSAALVATPIENNVTASASSVHYQIKKSGYVYKNAHIKATKSHSAKHYFGLHKLTVKKTIVVKRHGKKLVYKYVVASNGRSGYVYAGTIKRVVVKHVKKVAKKKVHVNKKAVKKVVKKTTKKAVKKTTAQRVKAEPNKSQAQKNLNDLYAYLGNYNADSDNSGSQDNSQSLNSLSDSQIASQVKSQFIAFVNQQRQANGKAVWNENAKLDAVAQKRASYVDSDSSNAHYVTADGQYHSEGAVVADAKSLGLNPSGLFESVGDFTQDGTYGTVSGFTDFFKGFITDDASSNYGHRNQLLGISGNGLNNVGAGVRVDKDSSNGSVKVNIVILSSDTAY